MYAASPSHAKASTYCARIFVKISLYSYAVKWLHEPNAKRIMPGVREGIVEARTGYFSSSSHVAMGRIDPMQRRNGIEKKKKKIGFRIFDVEEEPRFDYLVFFLIRFLCFKLRNVRKIFLRES